ncbi:MAG: hypothetical protein K6G12_06935 [Lachnospiraceae bacterium]|nr:hypothetical protein [Lachnospiraceae bacterium]
MTDKQKEWTIAKGELIKELTALGFHEELGELIAKQLGSPKAMRRMTSYLYNVRPQSEELVVDEMLAISSDIAAWKAKKESEAANAGYNELLYFGLGTEE